MNRKKIIIAHAHTSIEIFHSLLPFIRLSYSENEFDIKFIDHKIFNLNNYQADLLIIVRKYQYFDPSTGPNKKAIISELKNYRKNYSKIVYFDDNASVTYMFFFIFPFIDSYWVRGLLNENESYKSAFYGARTFSNFYHEKYKVKDDPEYYSPTCKDVTQLKKVKIAWNIGIGCFPTNERSLKNRYYKIIRKVITGLSITSLIKPIYFITDMYLEMMKNELQKEINLEKKVNLIHARFSSKVYHKSIGFQRDLLTKKIKKYSNCLSGKVELKQYIKECGYVFATLSPFGWGEVCYRDFEAAIGGSILIKPDMSHLITWPNIYQDETYISLDWDFNNLSLLENLENKKEKFSKYVIKSREIYLNSLNSFEDRAKNMINNVIQTSN